MSIIIDYAHILYSLWYFPCQCTGVCKNHCSWILDPSSKTVKYILYKYQTLPMPWVAQGHNIEISHKIYFLSYYPKKHWFIFFFLLLNSPLNDFRMQFSCSATQYNYIAHFSTLLFPLSVFGWIVLSDTTWHKMSSTDLRHTARASTKQNFHFELICLFIQKHIQCAEQSNMFLATVDDLQ